jgi:uncharacterized protein (DUF342 family)
MEDAKKTPTPTTAPLKADSSQNQFKISYNPEKRRVRLVLSGKYCAQTEAPPATIMKKAVARLSKAKEAGEISSLKLFEERLQQVWKELRKSPTASEIIITLGQGWPLLKGVTVKPSQVKNAIAEISIESPTSETKNWRLDWLVLEVEQQLAMIGISERPSPAKLHTILYNARAGVKIRNAALLSKSQHIGHQPAKVGYRIIHNKVIGEVVLVIYDLKEMQGVDKVKHSLDSIEQRLNTLVAGGYPPMRIFKKGIVKTIADAQEGPEKLGLDLPLMVLAATRIVGAKTKVKIATAAAAAVAAAPKQAHTAYLAFQVSTDQMQAVISHVNPTVFLIPHAKITSAWLQKELKQAGILHGIKDEVLLDVIKKIKGKLSPVGFMVAEGQPSSAGKDPKLVEIGNGLNAPDSGNKNFRMYSQQLTVKAGQLVAEIRCQVEAIDGMSVTGVPIKGAEDRNITVKVGDGIERKPDGKFYAIKDGIYLNDESGMHLLDSLVHQGDVNFTTGNISFEGTVEIKGNIASGASVFAGGDLTVHGEIRGGHVRCNGNLKIENGIVLGTSGIMRVGGNIEADFIENSTIHCGGVVTVKKSILASNIVAGTGVEILNRDGVLGGGSIVTGEFVKTGKLGLSNGARTEVKTGVNIKAEMKLNKQNDRLKKLNDKCDQERNQIKELSKKGTSHLTKANKDLKTSLTARIPKWKRILERVHKLVASLTEAKSATNSDAKIEVADMLAANCLIKIGSQNIPVEKAWTSVVISLADAANNKFIVQQTAPSKKEKVKKAS